MQRNERPVLGKDEVVVPPPVVAAVPQLDHMQHALAHLSSHLILVLHPLDVKYNKYQTQRHMTHNLINQPKTASLLPFSFQQVGDAVFYPAGVWEKNKYLVAYPRELIVPEPLFDQPVMDGCPVGPGDSVDADNDVGEIGVERSGESTSHRVG